MKWMNRYSALPVFTLALALGVAGCNKTANQPAQDAGADQSGQDQGDPAAANMAPVVLLVLDKLTHSLVLVNILDRYQLPDYLL